MILCTRVIYQMCSECCFRRWEEGACVCVCVCDQQGSEAYFERVGKFLLSSLWVRNGLMAIV